MPFALDTSPLSLDVHTTVGNPSVLPRGKGAGDGRTSEYTKAPGSKAGTTVSERHLLGHFPPAFENQWISDVVYMMGSPILGSKKTEYAYQCPHDPEILVL